MCQKKLVPDPIAPKHTRTHKKIKTNKNIINERRMRDCCRGYLQNLFIRTETCLMRPIEGLKQSHFHNKGVRALKVPLLGPPMRSR